MAAADRLVWIDCEMTGLDLGKDQLVEIAVIVTDADLTAFAPDDTNNRVDLDIPDQTWTAVANDGTGAIGAVVIAYDSDTTGGTDANIEPQTLHDFAVTPSGGDVTMQVAAAGFYRAS